MAVAFETEESHRGSVRGSIRQSFAMAARGSRKSLGVSMVLVETAPDQPRGELEPTGAMLNLVTCVIGAGVVAMPKAVGSSGSIGGFALLIFCGTLATTMVWCLCDACTLAEKQGHPVNSYDDIGVAAWGSWARPIPLAAVNMTLYGGCCIFIRLLGKHVSMVVDGVFLGVKVTADFADHSFPLGMHKFGGWMVVCTVILIPFSWLKDMSQISRFAWIGVVGSFGVCIAAVIGAILSACNGGFVHDPEKRFAMPPDFDSFVGSLCAILFAFAGISVIPTMRKDMREPEMTATACGRGMIIVTSLYVFISLPAVIAWGIPGDSVVELMEGGPFITGAKVIAISCLTANLFLTYPILLNVNINALAHIVPSVLESGVFSLCLRSMLVVLSFFIGFFCKTLDQMFDITAAVTIASTMVYLNLGFYWTLLARDKGSLMAAIKSEPFVKVVWHALVFPAGVCATVVGLRSGLGY